MRQSALWGKGGRGIIATLAVAVGLASFTGVAAAANEAAAGTGTSSVPANLAGKQLAPGIRPGAAWSSGQRDVVPPPAAWATLPLHG